MYEDAARLSFSRLRTYRRCPALYHWTYNEGIQRASTGLKIATGEFIHRLLAPLHRGEDWRGVWETIRNEYSHDQLFEEEAEKVERLADDVYYIVDRYERLVYQSVFAPHTVLHVEDELVIPESCLGFPVVIVPDLVIQEANSGLVWLVDHKTTKDFPEDLEINIPYDDQINLYLWGLRELGYNVTGAIHNYIRTRLPRKPELTKTGRLSRSGCITDEETVRLAAAEYRAQTDGKYPPPDDVEDYIATMRMAAFFKTVVTFRSDAVLDRLADEYRRTKMMMEWAAAGPVGWPRTFLPRECPYCPLRELCMADLQGGDTDVLLRTIYKRRGEERRIRYIEPEEVDAI